MSSKIYFNTAGRFSFKRWLTGMSTTLHHRLAPRHARKLARDLLLTPQRDQRSNEPPAGLVQQNVATAEGSLMTYRLGDGPLWLLMHGWSGSSRQLFPLMQEIAAAGFTALAYDHPAHGQSSGHHGHLPRFVRALETLLDTLPAPVAVTAHSMGAAVLLSTPHPSLQHCPLLLVAPVLDYVPQLYGMVRRSGYSMPLFSEVVGEIEQQYRMRLADVDPLQALAGRVKPVLIVHDNQDRFAPYADSQKAARLPEVTLLTTQGEGHGRILACDALKEAARSLATMIQSGNGSHTTMAHAGL
ncbi:Lysophospholipase, alpha-beta hydrolase superfamily [Aeromonas sp. RU39B]|uniref:alpha/beta hydrolase n=1 Tax=Aeromonas sp. RU39B TaxID=1907416 RepID=UPI0009540E79|nr:alpha/beta fold hydrolase [Aeromonas sp. RU39B]SIP90212.1 Lysophospholipase, alpha-beta hydrolase superfamily [Aeromonas sp. RU39B]